MLLLHCILLVLILIIIIRIILRMNVKLYYSDVSMSGKVVIVTGANTGIGYEIAKGLAGRGARVILACRNEGRATQAKKKIINETGNTNVVFRHLDLASLRSVRKFCEDFNRTEERLDVLVNNAGIYGVEDTYTEDGILVSMQVNYFGPFLLTLLLLPLLKKSRPSRIVNISSKIHYFGVFKPENINRKGYYSNVRVYCNSKLCNVIFTVELARRQKGSGVVVNAVHPGILYTDLTKDASMLINILFKSLCWLCYRTVHEAAQTPIFLSIAKECENISGEYFVDCKQWPMSWMARNKIIGLNLWEYSKKMVKYKDEDINTKSTDDNL